MSTDEARNKFLELLAAVSAREGKHSGREEWLGAVLPQLTSGTSQTREILEEQIRLNMQAAGSLENAEGSGTPEARRNLIESLSQAARQLEQLRTSTQAQTETMEANTQAVSQNSATIERGGWGSAAKNAGNVAASIFGRGFGLVPLLSGITKLFGNRTAEAGPALEPYAPPPAIQLEAGILQSHAGLYPITYGQGGLPRPVSPPAAQAPAVTIQVQAMDSRSFLDHSDEIARAVREAILNSHSLNDVMAEL